MHNIATARAATDYCVDLGSKQAASSLARYSSEEEAAWLCTSAATARAFWQSASPSLCTAPRSSCQLLPHTPHT